MSIVMQVAIHAFIFLFWIVKKNVNLLLKYLYSNYAFVNGYTFGRVQITHGL